MHIGLIGGIGVASTLAYYQRLTRRISDLGGKADLTIVHAEASTLVANIAADRREAQAQVFLPLIQRLQAAGADCVAITSLGGHFCFDETQALSPLPLVSGVTPLDRYFAQNGIGAVGLLGTKIVMRTGLYGQLKRTGAIALPGEIEVLGDTYIDMALSGQCLDAQRLLFFQAGQRMVQDHGAEAIVLAGTDLNLAFDGHDPGYRVIDALDVHLDILAQLALGKLGLKDLEEAA